MSNMENAVVIDPGSKTLKAGLALNFPNDEEPRVVIPSLVEVRHDASQLAASKLHASKPGEGKQGHSKITDKMNDDTAAQPMDIDSSPLFQSPIQQGKIVNFDQFEALLFYVLYELLGWVHNEEGQVVIAEPLMTAKNDREQLAQLFFEVFNVSGFFLQDSAVLALYAVGKLSGCVVDIGDSKIDITTVSEGTANYAATRRLAFAGNSLSNFLQELLEKRGSGNLDPAAVEFLKEKCSKAADSPYEFDHLEKSPPAEETFTLPDGQQFTVTTEGYKVAEALFRPALFGIDQPGISEAVAECIGLGADRKILHENIFVCGGGSSIANLQSRFLKDMRLHTAPSMQPSLCHVPDYMPSHMTKFAPWIGGAVLAKVVLQQNHFVTKTDYEELGPYAVHRKCN